MSAIGAIALAAELAQLALTVAAIAEQTSAVIARAQAEGRDVTPEELAAVRSRREAAVAKWFAPPAPVSPESGPG